jgi:Lipid A 3-O-deacylase (PagL)
MVRESVEKSVPRGDHFKLAARLLVCASLICVGLLFASAFASPAQGQSAPERSLDNELSLWGGYSFDSPHVFGVTSDRRLGLAAFRYAREWHTWQKVSLEYKVDVFPLVLVDQPKIVTTVLPGPPPETIYFNNGREAVYAGGINPIGLKLNFLPHRRFQPFLESSIGFVIAVRPIPFDVPGEDQFNLTFDFGAGFERFNSSRNRSWRFGYRYQHISNAYRSSINPGMDGNVIFFGYSFFK